MSQIRFRSCLVYGTSPFGIKTANTNELTYSRLHLVLKPERAAITYAGAGEAKPRFSCNVDRKDLKGRHKLLQLQASWRLERGMGIIG